MKELNLLVENYFTPTLNATDILRLVEQVMEEAGFEPVNFPDSGHYPPRKGGYLDDEINEAGGPQPFTAKAFPKTNDTGTVDNSQFPSAGASTQHSQNGFKTIENPERENQQPTHHKTFKATSLLIDGEQKPVPVGTLVQFLPPWQLKTGSEIGLGSRGTFAMASAKGIGNGYINIRTVTKPSGGAQARVATGKKAQDAIMDILKTMAKKDGVEASLISTAAPHSNKPDLVAQYGKHEIQFEIKGRKNDKGLITFFDKSASRKVDMNKVLEDALNIYLKHGKVDYEWPMGNQQEGVPIKDALKKTGFESTMIGVMDFFKAVDPRVGFAGDTGVIKSGKLPKWFDTQDATLLVPIRNLIVEHLQKGGDEYFAVNTKTHPENPDIYWTGIGSNPLNLGEIPQFQRFALKTYGGVSSGSTRVGFKVVLEE